MRRSTSKVRPASADARLKNAGQTGLQWAAVGGNDETVRVLLERGAPVDVQDEEYETTPLEWCVYGWSGARDAAGRESG